MATTTAVSHLKLSTSRSLLIARRKCGSLRQHSPSPGNVHQVRATYKCCRLCLVLFALSVGTLYRGHDT
jgi:hypothetical protein